LADRAGQRDVAVRRGQGCLIGSFQAMASPCEVLIETGDRSEARRLTELAAAEAWRIEDKFSRYRTDSAVSRINDGAGRATEVDDETAALLDFATTLYELSDGRFDITSGVLREVWTFDGSDRVPSADAVRDVLRRVGWQRVEWLRPVIRLRPGMQIDFGGIGKEYAVDRVVRTLFDASSCSALVNFGGDLAVTGPPADRESWKVGIESVSTVPGDNDTVIAIRSGALATSGDARRYLLKDGIRYCHILDPTSGWPVTDAPRSVTVAADTCTQAGMLSTLAMLKGRAAEDFLAAEGVRFWCRR